MATMLRKVVENEPTELELVMKAQHEQALRKHDQDGRNLDALAESVFQAVEEFVEDRLKKAHERFLKHHHDDDPRVEKLIDICARLETRLQIQEDRYQRMDDALNRITELMVRR